MLWQPTKGLDQLAIPFKFALTTFLLICGIGYLLGVVNIWFSYSPVDGKPGLSVDDIRLAFHGDPSASKLEKAISGNMNQYLTSPDNGTKLLDWIKAGHKEDGYAGVQQIFVSDCDTCHSKDVATAGIVTDDYKSLEPLLQSDQGVAWPRLITLSHIHINGLLPLMFCLAIIFSFTRFGDKLKGAIIVFSFASFTIDVAIWYFAKLFAEAAAFVILGGILLGAAYALMIFLPLWELWIHGAHFHIDRHQQTKQ
ncbi:MAG TPA: hypothetical protein VMV83_01030 [Rectinemataceae bacterium]|nr:hypothetical protein [Rectinemataceae bacterium]